MAARRAAIDLWSEHAIWGCPMLPPMLPVRQRMSVRPIRNVPQAMEAALDGLRLTGRVRQGMRIGIPVGSRGIAQIPLLLRTVIDYVRRLGAEPVLVAAMGSHGGGTAAGQQAVLTALGVTEPAVGAPIICNTEAVAVARSPDGEPVWFDSVLARCDGLLVVNRVKPHTSFHGPLESGLTKMLVVGCGKAEGARQFHRLGAPRLAGRLQEFGQLLLERLPVLGGVAVLENGRDEIEALEPVAPDGWLESEERLLARARALLPGLPVEQLDLLVVDEMGKNIAGTGMDTNVIGRIGIRGMPEVGPRIERVVVLDLTEESHGNANGMGLADLVTRRLASKVDFAATYLNCLTATFLERAKLPMVMETDQAAIRAALQSLGDPPEPAIIRIRNTLALERMLVSPAVLARLAGAAQVEVVGEPVPWRFAEDGSLPKLET